VIGLQDCIHLVIFTEVYSPGNRFTGLKSPCDRFTGLQVQKGAVSDAVNVLIAPVPARHS
jgi:hypothetical protein